MFFNFAKKTDPMIQRIQSVYLSLIAFACIGLFFLPLATYATELAYLRFYIKGMSHVSPDPVVYFNNLAFIPLYVLNIAVMAMAFWALFSYQDRKAQMKLVRIGAIMNIALILLLFTYTTFYFEKQLKVTTEYEYGILLPVLSMLFFTLAFRAIKKDEMKVKAADRLR
jgi:hypothetical protein